MAEMAGAAAPPDAGETGMSKSQMKKQKRQQLRKEQAARKKEAEKAARRLEQETKHVRVKEHLSSMTEEELAAWREVRALRVTARREEKETKRAKLQAALQGGQQIVLDLEFAKRMTDGELRSLCQQLSYCYSANQRSITPGHLILTGVSDTMGEVLRQQVKGVENWMVTLVERPYVEHFVGVLDQLVYLTADSPNELQTLDPGKAYIIGGIVDRNRYKSLCFDKATEQGIATARLPIGEHMRLASSQVLCTNHVAEIMLQWMVLKDWGAAFRAVIPARKRKAGAVVGEADGKSSSGAEEGGGGGGGGGCSDAAAAEEGGADTSS